MHVTLEGDSLSVEAHMTLRNVMFILDKHVWFERFLSSISVSRMSAHTIIHIISMSGNSNQHVTFEGFCPAWVCTCVF